MAGFSGFSKETSRFLRGLGRNNEKAWFEAHRDDYEAHYLAPALSFIEEMGERLLKMSPGVCAEPRLNGSLFRVNRDVRFSKDKTPYKDHIDLWFWEGGDRTTAVSGFFLRIRANEIEIGTGWHRGGKPTLEKFRERLAEDSAGASLEKIVKQLERSGLSINAAHYKKLPKGFEPGSEQRDRLLRHAALYCSTSESLPEAIRSKAFLGHCLRFWRKTLPLHRWLVDEMA